MGEKEPKPDDAFTLSDGELKQLEALGKAAFLVKIAKHGNSLSSLNAVVSDAEETIYSLGIEHKKMVDEIPDGAYVTVSPGNKHKLQLIKIVGAEVTTIDYPVEFGGNRVTKDVSGAVLKLVHPTHPDISLVLDASNADGDYKITGVDNEQ